MATAAIGQPFPGKMLKVGQAGPLVTLLQQRLNDVGCGPIAVDGAFGPETLEAVEAFQVRSVDLYERPLVVDGQVGPLTWAVLFGTPLHTNDRAITGLLSKVVAVAAAEARAHVVEQPSGSNRGERVDQYLRSVGVSLRPGAQGPPWCAAFVYWCFDQAAAALDIANPAVKTAGVLDHWAVAGSRGVRRLSKAECMDEPGLVKPGMIFIISTGGGHGHMGLVEAVSGSYLTTVEGNTNGGGSREGIGVFRRTARTISGINNGFIDYGS